MVDAITDPDALAEEACRVGLIHPEVKAVLLSFPADSKAKACSLLQSIERKINGQPLYFHHFLALLKKLPGLVNLGIIHVLQKTYGKDVIVTDHLYGFICNLKAKMLHVLFFTQIKLSGNS